MATRGIDIRQSTDRILIRASLKDADGAKVTSGTTELRLYRLEDDGTLDVYDWTTNDFVAPGAGTPDDETTMTHQQRRDSTGADVDTGIWTKVLSTLTNFASGQVYIFQITNSTASPESQEREWQFGDVEGGQATATEVARNKYAGPRGPGIYYNDAAGNTATTFGTDGTYNNPVSSAAAAVTLAGSLGAKRIYLINDSTLTLGASMADYEFVGIGFRTNNIVSLNGQSVTQSAFYNLAITGAPANAGQFACFDCIFGAAMSLAISTTIWAVRCQLSSSMSLDGTTLDLMDCHCVGTTTTTMTFRSGIGNNSAVRAVRCSIDSLVVAGMTDTDTPDSLLLSGGNGDVTLQASCVGGIAEIHGDWRLTDSSAGTTVTDHTTYTTLALIESQTDDIGVAGAGLTAVPWNASWDTEVQSEVQDALEALLIESGISAGAGLTNDTGTQLTSINLRQAVSIILSAVGSVLAGAATSTVTTKPGGKPSGNTRLTVTADADGNRSAVVVKVPD